MSMGPDCKCAAGTIAACSVPTPSSSACAGPGARSAAGPCSAALCDRASCLLRLRLSAARPGARLRRAFRAPGVRDGHEGHPGARARAQGRGREGVSGAGDRPASASLPALSRRTRQELVKRGGGRGPLADDPGTLTRAANDHVGGVLPRLLGRYESRARGPLRHESAEVPTGRRVGGEYGPELEVE